MYEQLSTDTPVTITQLEQMYNEEAEMPLVSTNLRSEWYYGDMEQQDLVWEADSLYEEEPSDVFDHYWLEK